MLLDKRLFQSKLAESPLCTMCGVEDETVTHLFAECSYSTKLWEELQNALASKLSLPNVSPQNVILGISAFCIFMVANILFHSLKPGSCWTVVGLWK